MKTFAQIAATAALLAVLPFTAQAGSDQPGSHSGHQPTAAGTEAMSEGVVRKVNTEAAKLTLRHGELKNLGMPPMTMVFRVADPAMLEKLKPGDKVNFVAEKVGGQFTVTRIEAKN
jgi:Cu(I)/Ag(I) efflux system protein CusF